MRLKEGFSLLPKVRKRLMPAILGMELKPGGLRKVKGKGKGKIAQLEECDVLKLLRRKRSSVSALNYFKAVSESKLFQHTPVTYHVMIEKLGQDGEMDAVQCLLQQMKLDGLICSEDIFVSVIRLYAWAGSADQALKTFYRMREFGCSPTVKIYNHLLDALLQGNKFSMISPIYNNMKEEGLKPNVYTYNILLKALCKNEGFDAAHKLLVEMENKGCSPDEVSYTTVISALCHSGKLVEARQLIKKLQWEHLVLSFSQLSLACSILLAVFSSSLLLQRPPLDVASSGVAVVFTCRVLLFCWRLFGGGCSISLLSLQLVVIVHYCLVQEAFFLHGFVIGLVVRQLSRYYHPYGAPQ